MTGTAKPAQPELAVLSLMPCRCAISGSFRLHTSTQKPAGDVSAYPEPLKHQTRSGTAGSWGKMGH